MHSATDQCMRPLRGVSGATRGIRGRTLLALSQSMTTHEATKLMRSKLLWLTRVAKGQGRSQSSAPIIAEDGRSRRRQVIPVQSGVRCLSTAYAVPVRVDSAMLRASCHGAESLFHRPMSFCRYLAMIFAWLEKRHQRLMKPQNVESGCWRWSTCGTKS